MTSRPAHAAAPSALELDRAYHEQLYSGEAQALFAKAAVRAMRAHLVKRILARCRLSKSTRVLSLGCGIGDTELLLASHVGEVIGVDASPSAIRQATQDAARLSVGNARFVEGAFGSGTAQPGLETGPFDLVLGIYFLHHLGERERAHAPESIAQLLLPGGQFYGLDTSAHRLSGRLGALLIPGMMAKYQSPAESPLEARATVRAFEAAGFSTELAFYDFVSTPLAGLLPSWRRGYQLARRLDDLLVRTPLVSGMGNAFELLATRS